MEPNADVLRFFDPGGIPYALLILVITAVVARLVSRFLEGLGQRFADRRLVIQQAGSFTRFGIYLAGFAAASASVLVLTREVLLAVSGTLAVSVGFALKDLFSSVVAGLIILVDKPFQVGDRVTFGGYYGEIRNIGLRSVRMVTLDDTMVTIPNNKFLTDVVASGNAGSVEMMIQMDYYIRPDQDFAEAKRIVTEALTTSRFIHLQMPWNVSVAQVIEAEYLAIRLRAKAYVLDVRFEKAFETDVTERVLEGFKAAGMLAPEKP